MVIYIRSVMKCFEWRIFQYIVESRNIYKDPIIINSFFLIKNLILKQKSVFASPFLPKTSRVIIVASSFLASVSLLAVFGLEDSRVEDVDGPVVPHRSGYGLGRLDSGRQQMGPDQKVCLLDPGVQRQPGRAILPQGQAQMSQHHAKIRGEIVGQMIPAAVTMKPDTRRVLLLPGTIRQIDLAVFGPRKALSDLEELAITRIPGKHDVLLRLVPCFHPRWVLRRDWSRLSILADVSLQWRQIANLHATYREFLTCMWGVKYCFN